MAGKKKKKGKSKEKTPEVQPEAGGRKLSRKEFDRELRKLQVELCHLQEWVKGKGLRIIVVFEGRDAAGKGGVIKRITERVSPRVFRVVALPAPSDRERSQLFIQRYIQHFPAAGEVLPPTLLSMRRRHWSRHSHLSAESWATRNDGE